jgi:tetratricopeptide (TPR) repeat protein
MKQVDQTVSGRFQAVFRTANLAWLFFALSATITLAQSAEEEALKAVVMGETDGYYKRDYDAWKATWLTGPNSTRSIIVNSVYFHQVGWEKIEPEMLKDFKDNPKPLPVVIKCDNFLYSINGNMGWIEYDATLTIPTLYPKFKDFTRENRLLLKQDGKWKITNQVTISKNAFGSDPEAIESNLNGIGYKLMEANKLKEATEVLKLNAVLHPNSWNVFDSLGEVHAKAGNKTLAIQNYEKSLTLNPKSESGKLALAKLKQK